MHSQKKPRKLTKFFYRWHRRIGAAASVFLIWIVASGWLLNHTQDFHLSERNLQNRYLAEWYGLKSQQPTHVFLTASHWVANTSDQFFLDGKPVILPTDNSKPFNLAGVVESDHFLALLTAQEIILLDLQGNLIDHISAQNLPLAHVTKIGIGCAPNQLQALMISDGATHFFSEDAIEWKKCDTQTQWSQSQTISAQQTAQLEHYLIPGISQEKLIQDLHSGRFFGAAGVYFVDLIGLCLLILASSGLWLFIRRKQKH